MVHLVKLCVGISSVQQLLDHRAQFLADVTVHRTRMMPKQRESLLAEGSLYWVIGGKIQCRQRIIGLDAVVGDEGKRYCDIVMDPEIVPTLHFPRRPFQGWRYLKNQDTPPDTPTANTGEQPSAEMAEALFDLGLL